MKLKPFVVSERVVVGLTDGPRREVLEQLIKPLVDGGAVTDAKQFLDDLGAREEQVTTVMENGVAFPHTRSVAVGRLCLVVGLAEKAIHFSPDRSLVSRVFFCLGVPTFAPTSHIPILQCLATFARDEKRVERLLECTTPSQVVKLLANYKG
jgi:mannitol/fructose-specific phosphotransferase system IIA component (Ntr-type)